MSNSLFNQVKYVGFLGRGSQAEVHSYELPDGTLVAVKSITLNNHILDSETLTEINSLLILKDKPYIIQLLDIRINTLTADIMLKQHSGSLEQFISVVNKKERVRVFKDVARQLMKGLYYIHNSYINHRDIKPNNIFVDFNFDQDSGELLMDPECYYADFGLASQLPCTKKSYENRDSSVGSPGYRSPELLTGSEDYLYEPDVWALGITLLNYLTDDVHIKAIDEETDSDELNNIYAISDDLGIDVVALLNKHSIIIDKYHIDMLKAMLLFDIRNRVTMNDLMMYTVDYPRVNYLPKRGVILNKLFDYNTYFDIVEWGIDLSIQYQLSVMSFVISIDLFERYLANYNESDVVEIYLSCLSIGSKAGDGLELRLEYFKDYNLEDLRETESIVFERMNYMYMSCDIAILLDKLYVLNDPFSSLRRMYTLFIDNGVYPGNVQYKGFVKYL